MSLSDHFHLWNDGYMHTHRDIETQTRRHESNFLAVGDWG